MNGFRRLACVVFFGCALFLLNGCCTAPGGIIDTTAVDGIIVDLADNAGTIETQIVTVYKTVQENPENKALIEKQFGAALLSAAKQKWLILELSRVHATEVGRYAARIAYLEPFELETEKEKAKKWRAYALATGLFFIIAGYIAFRVLRR